VKQLVAEESQKHCKQNAEEVKPLLCNQFIIESLPNFMLTRRSRFSEKLTMYRSKHLAFAETLTLLRFLFLLTAASCPLKRKCSKCVCQLM